MSEPGRHDGARTEGEGPTLDRVQILGPFHSGTCLVFRYVQRLFHVEVGYHTLFWKHSLPPRYRAMDDGRVHAIPAPPQERFDGTLFLCMVRLPYFWLLSTLRQRYHWLRIAAPEQPSALLRGAVTFDGRGFDNLVQVWNAYYRAYETHLVPRAAVDFVRLEDLVQTPEAAIARLGRRLRRREDVEVERAIDEISNRPAKVEAGEPCVYGDEARREYVPERVPSRFEAHDLDFINRELAPALMSRFDYPFVS